MYREKRNYRRLSSHPSIQLVSRSRPKEAALPLSMSRQNRRKVSNARLLAGNALRSEEKSCVYHLRRQQV
jgi:hypothetical protein